MMERLIATFAFLKAMVGEFARNPQALLTKIYDIDGRLGALTEEVALMHPSADNRGQLGLSTILAAFVVAIAAMVVILVLDEFDQSLGDPASSDLNNSSDSILSGFADMSSLIGPLFLIAIGVVIIGLIRRVQGT